MPTARPFAYNTGSTIDGTDQIGDIAVGRDPQDYSLNPGGVRWWNGPDEDSTYIIAYPQPNGLHPTPEGNTTASVGFWGDKTKTDAGFLSLVENKLGQTFESAFAAKGWLSDQGYWSSYSAFGSSGFQWMNISSVTSTTASGSGQNGITVSITKTGGGLESHSGMYNATTFPEQYGVPLAGSTQILNSTSGVFTATFSQPVTNPLIAFASVGNPSLSVPVQSTNPFTPIWGISTTHQNVVNGTQYTQFTGNEGFNIIRIDGTLSSVSFNYTVSEYYSTICFGFVDQNA
jgi:hypothetical protein